MTDDVVEYTGPLAELNELLAWDPVAITYDADALGAPSRDSAETHEQAMEIEAGRTDARERLASEVGQLVKEATVEAEQPRPPGHFAIGPPPDDTVWLAIYAMEAYAAIRVVADDVRHAIAAISDRIKKPVRISRSAAQLLAWDAVVASGTYRKIELQYFAPMFVGLRIRMFQNDTENGWLFSFLADGAQITVVVRSDGEVLGSPPAPDLSIVEKLQGEGRHARKRKKRKD